VYLPHLLFEFLEDHKKQLGRTRKTIAFKHLDSLYQNQEFNLLKVANLTIAKEESLAHGDYEFTPFQNGRKKGFSFLKLFSKKVSVLEDEDREGVIQYAKTELRERITDELGKIYELLFYYKA